MRCERCGAEYASKDAFEDAARLGRLICTKCYESLSPEELVEFLGEPKASKREPAEPVKQKGACPECGSQTISRRRDWGTVINAFFIALAFLLAYSLAFAFEGMQGIFLAALGVTMVVIVAMVFGVVLGKNRCKACGHKWK